jgi:YHS domain-containing protein
MEVDPSNAAESYTYNGQTYHFCSHRCLTKFKEDPEKFLKGRANEHAAPAHEHAHVVHRLPKIRPSTGFLFVQWTLRSVSVQPGPCPKCGMALEPAAPATPSVKTEYVCPMHPEIVRPEPAPADLRHDARTQDRDLAGRNQSQAGRHDLQLGFRNHERAEAKQIATLTASPGTKSVKRG